MSWCRLTVLLSFCWLVCGTDFSKPVSRQVLVSSAWTCGPTNLNLNLISANLSLHFFFIAVELMLNINASYFNGSATAEVYLYQTCRGHFESLKPLQAAPWSTNIQSKQR